MKRYRVENADENDNDVDNDDVDDEINRKFFDKKRLRKFRHKTDQLKKFEPQSFETNSDF